MPNESAFPKSLLAAALSAAFPTVAHAQAVARVDFAAGTVTAQGADGRARQLTRGAEVRVGETVSTQDGRAQMRFSDGAYVSLQPQTDFKIDNYVFEGRGTPNESAVMSLLKGGMRTITGLIGRTNRDGYRLQTSTATVGIRGTQYSITYDAGGSVTMFVADGAIAVTNQSGTTVVPGGRSVTVNNQNSAPITANEKPTLPPQGTGGTPVNSPQNPTQDGGAPPITLLTGTIAEPAMASVYGNSSPITIATGPNNDAVASATLNGFGGLQSYTPAAAVEGCGYCEGALQAALIGGGSTPITNGTSTIAPAGNDGIIAWGRWIGGTDSAGRNLAPFPDGNGPFHYVVGLPVTNMPQSGEATYSAIGATASCGSSGCQSVAVTGATLSVNFGTLSGTHNTNMVINGVPSNFTGSLGVSSGAIDLRRFDASGSGYGAANGYSFEGSISGRGILAGDGASRAGMAFRVNGSVYGPDGFGYFSSSSISANGAIAYKKQ